MNDDHQEHPDMDFALARRLQRPPKQSNVTPRDLAAPGWFTDPSSGAQERFWTGTAWTGVTRQRDTGFIEAVHGVERTMFEKNVPLSRVSTRRLKVTTTEIKWGRWKMPTSEVASVWHWIEEDPDGVASGGAPAWSKLAFEVENRVSGVRIRLSNVGSLQNRSVAWDAYRAVTSVSATIIQPRIAVDYLERLSEGKEVRVANLRITSRGIVQRHVDPRRAALASSWDELTLTVDCDGRFLAGPGELARLRDGQKFDQIDPAAKNAPVAALLLWLAKDRFETKPLVFRQQAHAEWYDKAVS
jgi:Protein of unknown function (DUF2510)